MGRPLLAWCPALHSPSQPATGGDGSADISVSHLDGGSLSSWCRSKSGSTTERTLGLKMSWSEPFSISLSPSTFRRFPNEAFDGWRHWPLLPPLVSQRNGPPCHICLGCRIKVASCFLDGVRRPHSRPRDGAIDRPVSSLQLAPLGLYRNYLVQPLSVALAGRSLFEDPRGLDWLVGNCASGTRRWSDRGSLHALDRESHPARHLQAVAHLDMDGDASGRARHCWSRSRCNRGAGASGGARARRRAGVNLDTGSMVGTLKP